MDIEKIDINLANSAITKTDIRWRDAREEPFAIHGVLYDEDALMVDYQLDNAYSTPLEARKAYRNIWWHFAKNSINDFTENGILLYIGEGATEDDGE